MAAEGGRDLWAERRELILYILQVRGRTGGREWARGAAPSSLEAVLGHCSIGERAGGWVSEESKEASSGGVHATVGLPVNSKVGLGSGLVAP